MLLSSSSVCACDDSQSVVRGDGWTVCVALYVAVYKSVAVSVLVCDVVAALDVVTMFVYASVSASSHVSVAYAAKSGGVHR